jgi:multiple antibiotic resistance protein
MLHFLLTTIASILFVVDPLGAVPVYLVMVENDDRRRRQQTAVKAALMATATMIVFAAAGNLIFQLLGLTMAAFRIAGGLILFLVAIDMIRARRATQETPDEVHEGVVKDDVAITPLGVPMLAGPAALSTVAMLMSRSQGWHESAIVYGAIVVTGAIAYLTLRLAEPLYHGLGKTGIHVFTRVLGLILAAIAVQFVLDGLREAGLK